MRLLGAGLLACCLCAVALGASDPDLYGDPDDPIAGKVLGMVIHTDDPEALRYVILEQLTDRYASDKGIAVTQAERDAYVKHLQRSMAQDRQRQEARRDELTRRLAAEALPESERASLASERDTLNALLATLDELADSAAGDPAETAAARDQLADAFIRQWKINQALYREYGGRIIFQQGGPEPLDAYRRFLEERQARGDFELLDADLETRFWRYYLNDSIHSFYPPDSEEEAEVFQVPWWLSD
jgi:hypothetical protein